MGKYGVLELSAPVKATVETCYEGRAYLGDCFIDEDQGPEVRRENRRSPEHDVKSPGLKRRVMHSPTVPVGSDPEVARLQQALKDVRFCLERGDWQTALTADRAALIRNQAITVPRTMGINERNGPTTVSESPAIGTV